MLKFIWSVLSNLGVAKTKSISVIYVIIFIMVVIPILYFLYTGATNLLHSLLHIKTDKEIIVQQKEDINKLIIANNVTNISLKQLQTMYDLNQALMEHYLRQDFDITKEADVFKKRLQKPHVTEIKQTNIKNITTNQIVSYENNPISLVTDVSDKGEVILVKRNIPPPKEKQVFIKVDKKEYLALGRNTINVIYDMYKNVKDF